MDWVRLSNIFKNLCISGFFIVLGYVFLDVGAFTKVEVTNIRNEVSKTNTMINEEIPKLRVDTMALLNTTVIKLDGRISSIEDKAFAKLGSVETNLNTITSSVTKVSDEAVLLSQDYRKIPNTLNKFDKELNCVDNDFCWQNLTTDTLVSVRNMAQDGNKSFLLFNEKFPNVVKNMDDITADVKIVSTSFADGVPKVVKSTENITANIDRLTKPKWYDRLIGWGVNGSMIYFNINRGRLN